jgi:hypothetical protein
MSNEFTVGSQVNIYLVPSDTVITSATSALPLTAVNLGEVTEDGFKLTRSSTTQDVSTNNGGVVYQIRKSSEIGFSATLMDDNKTVREFIHGETEINGKISGDGLGAYRGALVADSIFNQLPDGSVKVKRVFYPEVQVTSTDDVSVNSGDVTKYGFTATANKIAGRKYEEFNAVIAANGDVTETPGGGGYIPQITLGAAAYTIGAGEAFNLTGQLTNSPATTVKVVVSGPDASTVEETVTVAFDRTFSYSYTTPNAQESMGDWSITVSTLPLGAESVSATVTVNATM